MSNKKDDFMEDPIEREEFPADEDDRAAGAEGSGEDTSIEGRLARAEEESAACRDRLLRLHAEFENFRKRQARERAEQRKSAGESIVKEMLPVLDSLEKAADHGEGDDAGKILEGVRLVLKQFRESLISCGVETVTAMGEVFDPHFHEAMSRVETDGDPPDGTVVEEYRKGYMLHEKVLRPAMVGVAKIVDGSVGKEGEE